MNLSKSFDRTLERYGITGKWLHEASGLSEKMISNFRNGKARVWSDSLERMIEVLPSEAQQYFFQSLSSSNVPLEQLCPDIEEMIEEMEIGALSTLLTAIASKLSPKTSDSTITVRDRVFL